MRHVPSKYVKFPVAIELPEIDSDRQIHRAIAIKEWSDGLDLMYQRDYICFEHEIGRGHRAARIMAWAFRKKAHALLFKLAFSSW